MGNIVFFSKHFFIKQKFSKFKALNSYFLDYISAVLGFKMATKISGLAGPLLAHMLCPFLKEALAKPSVSALTEVWLMSDLQNHLTDHTKEEFRKIVGAELIVSYRQKERCVALKRNPKMGWELVACKKIVPGEFIGEYAGEDREPSSKNESDYSLNGINSFYKRSLVVMANDGFPNMKVYPLDETRVGLFALTDIYKGESLTYQYGATHSVKRSIIHQESHPEELEKYFKKIVKEDSESLCRKLDEISFREKVPLVRAEIPSFLEDELFIERLIYVLTTPSVLYTLLLKKILTPASLRKILIHPRLCKIEDYSDWPFKLINEMLVFVEKTNLFSESVIKNLISLADECSASLLLAYAEMMLPSGVS